jgi:hypothetical protein
LASGAGFSAVERGKSKGVADKFLGSRKEAPLRQQRFKDWLRSTPKEEEPAKKEETPVKRL